MTEQRRLIDKVKDLVRQARLPRFFHRYGRKWHASWQLLLCHAVYVLYTRSWRRAARFMSEFYGISMDWTCWRKAVLKIPCWAWHALQRASAGDEPCLVAAIDGTTIARSNPSQHYYKRILDGKTTTPLQEVSMIDVARRKFLAWRIRAKPRGEKCDVPYLFTHAATKPGGVLLDKGFDAEWIHEYYDERDVWSVAPTRKGCRRGRHRKLLRDCFDHGLYWQRNIVEALFSAVKRIFGGSVRSRHWRAQRAEISIQRILYNLGALEIITICL